MTTVFRPPLDHIRPEQYRVGGEVSSGGGSADAMASAWRDAGHSAEVRVKWQAYEGVLHVAVRWWSDRAKEHYIARRRVKGVVLADASRMAGQLLVELGTDPKSIVLWSLRRFEHGVPKSGGVAGWERAEDYWNGPALYA